MRKKCPPICKNVAKFANVHNLPPKMLELVWYSISNIGSNYTQPKWFFCFRQLLENKIDTIEQGAFRDLDQMERL